MVEAHVVDAWTREADRHGTPYMYAVFLAGLAAPLFLFLAGLALAMSASKRSITAGVSGAAALARLRGWQVFALAFLFRLQSQLLGWGALVNFLKVDILNVMGLAMVMAGAIWGLGRARASRIALFVLATALMSMSTPLVREASGLALLPDPIEAYIRPLAGRSNFALFPWAAFLFAGAVVGELIGVASVIAVQGGLLAAGIAGIGIAYWASFQPSIYPVANFWTSSPTFFFIRLGLCTALVPIAWLLDKRPRVPEWIRSLPGAPGLLVTLGRSSLFVYWIHVEMVYGFLGRPFRRALPLTASITATILLCLILYGIVLWKNRVMEHTRLTGAFKIFSPVLK